LLTLCFGEIQSKYRKLEKKMSPHLRKIIPVLFLLFASTYSQAQQHVNLSTGSGAGIIDPIWQVKLPGSNTFQTSYRTGGIFYGGIYGNWSGANNCFNWTSP
jgi:predicted phosphoadenosine phosphosulfate sulfurtransferase